MLIPRVRSFFRNRFRRDSVEARLTAELEGYIEQIEAELLASGVAPAEARRQAVIAVGGLDDVKERVREARTGALLDTLLQDARLAWRGLSRASAFSATTIATIGLGLGAAVAVLAIADAILIRALPYRDANRLVAILQHGRDPVSPANFSDWKAAATSFAAMEAASYWRPTITEGVPEQIETLQVTPGLLRMLGVAPRLGIGFTASAGSREVVLGDALWRRRFAADSTIVGRTVLFDGEPHVVVAVMPPEFQFAPFWVTSAQAWVAIDFTRMPTAREASFLRAFARLRDEVTVAEAQRELSVITGRLASQFPESNRDIRVVELSAKAIGNARPALLALVGAIGCVLLITWLNVAHMLLARAHVREPELNLRVTLGATQLRLVRGALIETFLLVLPGGLLAMLGAAAALRLVALHGPFDLPQLRALSFDTRAAAIAIALTLVTSVVIAVLPGILAARVSRGGALAVGIRPGDRPERVRLRQLMIASEMAFALVLLVGTGLMIRTFGAMRAVDPGFSPSGVITMQVPVARSVGTGVSRADWFDRVRNVVRATPGVSEAGFINHLPLAGDEWGARVFGGVMENASESEVPRSIFRVVTPGLTSAMGIRLLEGRSVDPTDDLDRPPVAVVNRRLARQLWPSASALGQRITFSAPNQARAWLTVVGVVDDVKQSQWTAPSDPEVYLPYSQARMYLDGTGPATSYLTLAARTSGDPAGVANAVRSLVAGADPTAVVTQIETLDEVVGRMTARARFLMSVLIAFGVLALVLVAVGIYGLLAYTVSQRRRELGIRMALGASTGAVTTAVAAETARVALVGVAIGALFAAGLTGLVVNQLYGVAPHDPASFVAAVLCLTAVAVIAGTIPVRRAVRIDPLSAIRSD